MKGKIFTLLVVFMTLFMFSTRMDAQTIATTNPLITGVDSYNIIWTDPVTSIDYYMTNDLVTTGSCKFMPKVTTDNSQAFKLTYAANNGTYGNRFKIESILNPVYFAGENVSWKNSGYSANWHIFYFVKDDITGFYAIKSRPNNDTGKFWKVPTLPTGVTSYFTTAPDAAQITIPAQGSPFYCFKVVAATLIDPIATDVQKIPLNAEITTANSLYTNGNEGTLPGQYPTAVKTAFNTAIATAISVFNSTTSTGIQVVSAISALQVAEGVFKNAIIVETNTLVDGNYFIKIKDASNNYFYLSDFAPRVSTTVSSPTSMPVFHPLVALLDSMRTQIFKITKDPTNGRYKLESQIRIANHLIFTHLNESLYFPSKEYSPDFSSFTIFKNENRYGFQGGGKAPKTYFKTSSVSDAATLTSTGVYLSENLVFELEADYSASLKDALDSALVFQVKNSVNIGTSLGQYTQADYDTFGAAITAASSVYNTSSQIQSNFSAAIPVLNAATAAFHASLNKLDLQTHITEAADLKANSIVGITTGTFPQEAYDAFGVAIAIATSVFENVNSTSIQVIDANSALNAARTTFTSSVNLVSAINPLGKSEFHLFGKAGAIVIEGSTSEVTVFDITGKIIVKTDGVKSTISVPSGLYIVKAVSIGEPKVVKVIVE